MKNSLIDALKSLRLSGLAQSLDAWSPYGD